MDREMQTIKSSHEEYLSIFTDGGSRGNPGPAAIGFVIKDNQGKVLRRQGKFIGRATNNVAEYTAVIGALKALEKLRLNEKVKINFYLDSLLVVNQLNGCYKIKNATLKNLFLDVRRLEAETKSEIIYRHIPRERNVAADTLVNQSLDNRNN